MKMFLSRHLLYLMEALMMHMDLDLPLKDKVIVFSGDTGPSKTLEKFAAGADILFMRFIRMQDF